MNNVQKNTINNLNIVYKKTSDYDNDLSTYSSNNSQVDLDESVLTIDDNNLNINNYKLNKQNSRVYENNINLRDNINKEIVKNLNNNNKKDKPTKFSHNQKNIRVIENYINDNNDTNDSNNKTDNTINNSFDSENKYINNFIHYIKTNGLGTEIFNDVNLFKEIIKFYIINKNFNQNEIELFIKTINNNKLIIFNNIKNSNNVENSNNVGNLNNAENLNNIENFYSNGDNENKQNTFIDKLINNDINTWIFIGMILISFVIIIMIIINKK